MSLPGSGGTCLLAQDSGGTGSLWVPGQLVYIQWVIGQPELNKEILSQKIQTNKYINKRGCASLQGNHSELRILRLEGLELQISTGDSNRQQAVRNNTLCLPLRETLRNDAVLQISLLVPWLSAQHPLCPETYLTSQEQGSRVREGFWLYYKHLVVTWLGFSYKMSSCHLLYRDLKIT